MANLFKYLKSINQSSPIVVYIDMDGVLADLHGGQEDFIKKNIEDIFKDADEALHSLSKKEKNEILKNIFSKKSDLISSNKKEKVKNVYWTKFIEQKYFEKLDVLTQVKTLSDSLKLLKGKYPETRVEILGSTGNQENHHKVSEQKKIWLKSNKNEIDIFFDRYNFVSGRKLKQNYATTNSILIDDTLSNCEEFRNAGGMAFHVDNNMNELTNKLETYSKKIKGSDYEK